jgi:phosphatidate phosphatase PAH1
MQKRVIRTIMGYEYRESCRKLFVELEILQLTSQYIFSLLLFVVKNICYFTPNNVYYDSNTRHRNDLHLPQVTLAMYQRGVYYSGIKVFNGLPRALKDISSKPEKFKIALRKFLQTRSFYSLDEFFFKVILLVFNPLS